ncbi:hypothetical protein SALB_07418 [Streptomyces noursei]|uniref:Uncharacterized protein n=1 Tax=Streptomyces noursei TaxID=1971 RepID=A0A401RAI2_STRNR|nr:hypothetical protein SALB_07418 [Streptomyces noursei]
MVVGDQQGRAEVEVSGVLAEQRLATPPGEDGERGPAQRPLPRVRFARHAGSQRQLPGVAEVHTREGTACQGRARREGYGRRAVPSEAVEQPRAGWAVHGGAKASGGGAFEVVEEFLADGGVHAADRQVPGDPAGEGEPGLQDVLDPAAVRPQGAHGEFAVARARSGAARGEGEADAAARFVGDDAVADGSVPAVGSDAQGPVEAQRRPGGCREGRVGRAAHVVEEGPRGRCGGVDGAGVGVADRAHRGTSIRWRMFLPYGSVWSWCESGRRGPAAAPHGSD